MKILVVGSANMDLIVSASKIPVPGETISGENFAKAHGGKGANQAVAAARMGNPVTMIAAVGDDSYGLELVEGLRVEGIDVSRIETMPGTSGIAVITVEKSGQNSIVVIPGANAKLGKEFLSGIDHINAKVLLCQLETPLPTVVEALEKGHSANCFTILDPAPAHELPRELAPSVDLITPNETEAEILTGEKDPRKAAAALHAMGYTKVIVTLGTQGVLYSDGEEQLDYAAYVMDAVDTTAAGDAFNAALAAEIARGSAVTGAIPFAMACAALSVTKQGAQPSLPKREEVERFMQNQ